MRRMRRIYTCASSLWICHMWDFWLIPITFLHCCLVISDLTAWVLVGSARSLVNRIAGHQLIVRKVDVSRWKMEDSEKCFSTDWFLKTFPLKKRLVSSLLSIRKLWIFLRLRYNLHFSKIDFCKQKLELQHPHNVNDSHLLVNDGAAFSIASTPLQGSSASRTLVKNQFLGDRLEQFLHWISTSLREHYNMIGYRWPRDFFENAVYYKMSVIIIDSWLSRVRIRFTNM